MNILYLKIKELADIKGVSLAQIERDLNFSNGIISSWKNGRASQDKLSAIADYFNVSTDYLLGRKEDSKTKNDDKQVDLTGIGQKEDEEKIFSYEGKEIPRQDLELIRRILETGEYVDNKHHQ